MSSSLRRLQEFLRQHVYPREAVGIIIAVCSSITFVLVVFFLYDTRITAELQWSRQEWLATNCSILHTGIEYVGDCEDRKVQKEVDMESKNEGYDIKISSCPVAGCDAQEVQREEAEKTSELQKLDAKRRQGRRLFRSDNSVFGILCRDVFAPWAHVRPVHSEWDVLEEANGINGSEVLGCGYRTGLAKHSAVESLAEALQLLEDITAPSGDTIEITTCWLLNVDSGSVERMARWTAGMFGVSWRLCAHGWAIALQDPQEWPESDPTWAMIRNMIRMSFLIAACGFASIAGALTYWSSQLWYSDIRNWEDLWPSSGGVTVQQYDSESARLRELRERWSVFKAGMMAQYHLVSVDESAST